MTRQRRRFSAQTKAKVAVEAIKGQRTVAELASQFQVHPNQISQWKRQMLDAAPLVFSNGRDRQQVDQQELVDQLYQQIGRLKVEVDWLKKKLEIN